MPNEPKTPIHGFRIPDDLWQRVKAKAAKRSETVTDVVLRALRAYADSDGD